MAATIGPTNGTKSTNAVKIPSTSAPRMPIRWRAIVARMPTITIESSRPTSQPKRLARMSASTYSARGRLSGGKSLTTQFTAGLGLAAR